MSVKKQKINKKEQLTNWYMINLCWGIVGLIALTTADKGYKNVNTLLHMQTVMYIFTGVFAAGAIALFAIAASNKAKNIKRLKNYGFFSLICAFVSLWLALYNKLRPIIEKCIQGITNNASFTVSSYWNIKIPIILIIVYLIAAFIYYLIKIIKK